MHIYHSVVFSDEFQSYRVDSITSADHESSLKQYPNVNVNAQSQCKKQSLKMPENGILEIRAVSMRLGFLGWLEETNKLLFTP